MQAFSCVCLRVYVHVCCLLYPSADCRCLDIQAVGANMINVCTFVVLQSILCEQRISQDQETTVKPVFLQSKTVDAHLSHNLK